MYMSFQWADTIAWRPSSVCLSVNILCRSLLIYTTGQMAGSPANLHRMGSRWACIQGVLKFKVEVKGDVISCRCNEYSRWLSWAGVDVCVMCELVFGCSECESWWCQWEDEITTKCEWRHQNTCYSRWETLIIISIIGWWCSLVVSTLALNNVPG